MNTYYNVIQEVKGIFEMDSRVNSVVTGDFEQWDKDYFLLVHIDVTDAPYVSGNTANTQFNIAVTVLDIRDVNKENVKDKFWHNDTRHDSWNDTYSVLKLATNRMVKHQDISLNTATSAERITYAYMNGLDGWQQTWTLDVPDNFTSVCFNE